MVTIEKMLFDVNEAWQDMGLIPADDYVTVNTLAVALLIAFLLAPIQGRILARLITTETFNKYIAEIVIGNILGILIITGNYGAIVICVLLLILVHIIYSNPQYKSIQEYIDRIF